MPEHEDDPRQVLAVLNSLGFVGITAQQLKAFMKDLKLLRKIKERERQQWKEEMKRKIFFKQQKALAELLDDNSPRSNSTTTPSSNDSIIKIKIRCISESDSDNDENQEPRHNIQRHQSPSPPRRQQVKKEIKPKPVAKIQGNKTPERQKILKEADNRKSRKSESEVINSLSDRTATALELTEKVKKRSRSKSIASESTCSRTDRPMPSRSSSRSRPKSFIRPWKLRPEVTRLPQVTKSDPVMMYQKYKEEWKKNPLPGENSHTRVRWEIRQKMLGGDPAPKPILKKSCSTMSIKKR